MFSHPLFVLLLFFMLYLPCSRYLHTVNLYYPSAHVLMWLCLCLACCPLCICVGYIFNFRSAVFTFVVHVFTFLHLFCLVSRGVHIVLLCGSCFFYLVTFILYLLFHEYLCSSHCYINTHFPIYG
jgi:hypothetical protein